MDIPLANSVLAVTYLIGALSLLDWTLRHLRVEDWVQRFLSQPPPPPPPPDPVGHVDPVGSESSVTLVRSFKEQPQQQQQRGGDIVDKVDAVLDHICSIDDVKHIRMDVRASLNTRGEIVLTPNLKARVTTLTDVTVEVVLYSTTLKISDIRAWIDDIHATYTAEKNNRLGNRLYYFDEIDTEPPTTIDMSQKDAPRVVYRWENMPKMLTFTMNEFKTSKSFSNIYGHHVDELKERLDLFLHHPEWYAERGIPHTLGILLYGVPGAGKTSTIKGLIKDSRRHPFNIRLRPYTTQRQLTNLFFNETVVVQLADGTKQTLKIPLNKRLYILEDVDCLSDVVIDRTLRPPDATSGGEALTLSFLLNLLDGVLEIPGRMVAMSSNRPEQLDSALIRPGRIDVRIRFTLTDRDYLHDMFSRFYKVDTITAESIPESIVDEFTPAEVMESMCNNIKSPDAAIAHLVSRARAREGITYLEPEPAPAPAPVTEVTEVEETKEETVVATPSTHTPVVPVVPTPSQKKMIAFEPLGSSLLSSTLFEDDMPPPGAGGWFPGQPRDNDVRAPFDLNTQR